MRRIALLALALTIAACSDSEEPRDTDSLAEVGAPHDEVPAAQQTDEPQFDPLYQQLASARGLPLVPWPGPNHHFFFQGSATFRERSDKPDPREIVQGLSIALGSAQQVKYVLEYENRTNQFLLDGEHRSWQRVAGSTEYQAVAAESLALDTWARWILCRFPWDQRRLFADLEVEVDPDTGLRVLEFLGPFGFYRITLNAEDRPAELTLEQPELWLRIGDWRKVPGGDTWLPHRWQWSKGGDSPWTGPTELMDIAIDRVLSNDATYRPPNVASASHVWVTSRATVDGPQRATQDDVRVIDLDTAQFFLIAADDTWPASLDEHTIGLEYAVVDPDGTAWRAIRIVSQPEELPAGVTVRKSDAGAWLSWRTFVPIDSAKARERMTRWAASNQRALSGSLWSVELAANAQWRYVEFLLRID